jgi:hypothetical protein
VPPWRPRCPTRCRTEQTRLDKAETQDEGDTLSTGALH